MNEDISQEDHHSRETYARYGLAMYFAQVVEAGMKGALILAQLNENRIATQSEFDDVWDSNFKVVMGRLIGRLRPYLDGDEDLDSDLQLVLAVRNQLAHHFFWDHAADALSDEGRDRMIVECDAAVVLFRDVNERLHLVMGRFATARGFTSDQTAAHVDAAQADLLARRDGRNDHCGRCMIPMDLKGTERRLHFECPNCGAVALT